MARIIHLGKVSREVAVYLDRDCRSTIEFERADVKSDQRDGDFVVCPVCDAWISASLLQWKEAE